MREKLIELISRTPSGGLNKITDPSEFANQMVQRIADYLLLNGVTVQKWIPVTERLPEKNGRYLCRYIFNDHYDMPFEQVLSYFATDKKPHFQNESDEFGMKVTHWIPLPEPPKGE